MDSPDRTIVNDGFAWRLALFYAAFFAAAGLYLPFFPVWLAAKGLDAAAIGIVLAAPQTLRFAAIPIGTRLADRRGDLRGPLAIAAFGSAAGVALVSASDGFVAILIAVTLTSLMYAPVMPLAEAYALKGLAVRARSYGPVRLWGSVAFIAANLGGGVMLASLAPQFVIWPILGSYLVMALVALILVPLPPAPPREAREAKGHLRGGAFIAVMLAAAFIQGSHAAYYGFSVMDWTARGLSGPAIGALWAIGVAAEVVLFALAPRLPAMSYGTLIAIGAAGGVLRWAAMALEPSAMWLAPLQVLHALSFGATHLGTMAFLSRHAPEGSRAAAQGDVSVAISLAMGGAMALSGTLYQAYGGLAYAAMAVMAAAGGVTALAARRL